MTLLRRRPAKTAPVPGSIHPKPVQHHHPAAPPAPAADHPVTRPGGPTLMDLPPELHLQITKYLIYPDALSLKHVSRYFHALVFTGVTLKVEWLVQRRSLHLECPSHTQCDLGSDLRFCRGSVALLMKRRREHMECESRRGVGCMVYSTPTCSHRRSFAARWLRTTLTAELWWLLLAAVPIVLCAVLGLM